MPLTDNLVAYYKFDEGTGTSVADAVGGNTGTFANGSWGTGTVGSAGSFNGTSSKVTSANNSGITGTAASIALWIKPSSLPASTGALAIIGSGNAGGALGLFTGLGNAGALAGAASVEFWGTPGKRSTTAVITINVWNHVAVSWAGPNQNSAILYVNGAVVTTGAGASTASIVNSTILIGSDTANEFAPACLMDEVGFWSRALSAAEVSALYNAGAGLPYPFSLTTDTYLRNKRGIR